MFKLRAAAQTTPRIYYHCHVSSRCIASLFQGVSLSSRPLSLDNMSNIDAQAASNRMFASVNRWRFASYESGKPSLVFSTADNAWLERPCPVKGRVWLCNVDAVLHKEWLDSIRALYGVYVWEWWCKVLPRRYQPTCSQ